MGASSGANFNHTPKMLPPRQHPRTTLQTSLSLASSDPHEPLYNSDQNHDSPTDSTSSRETWPIQNNHSNSIPAAKKLDKEKEGENEYTESQVVRRMSSVSKQLTLREVAHDRIEVVSDRMSVMPVELLDELKNKLRVILEGTGGPQNREELLNLQHLVHNRTDLSEKSLVKAHRVQLEILVAINTGIQAFLHPNISIPQSHLIEVFLYKRCRNIACQSSLPADECSCDICTNRNGFCNQCMCGICNKFDFEVNTCRWIGCDVCAHWTHTDCAMHLGRIGMGQSGGVVGYSQMLFRCQACNKTSELLGWVKDVFQHCAHGWDRDALIRELELVSRIFRISEDPKGRKLFWKCGDLIEKMKSGATASTACKMLMLLFQELEIDSTKNLTEGANPNRQIAPQEACNQIAEVVQEAVRKMEMVAEEKLRLFKRARLSLEACDRELEDKAREVTELKRERQRKKQQVEELESIVRLKQAEAEMFQLKATEARQEAERLESIALAKSEKAAAEQDYASMYLKRRLDEAEAEKQYLFEKIKLQESQRAPAAQIGSSSGVNGSSGDPSQMLMCKIQDLLKNVYNPCPKSDGQQRSK